MQVKFLRLWRCHQPGAVVELGGGVADTLQRRGIVETMAMAGPPERRKRGRPKGSKNKTAVVK